MKRSHTLTAGCLLLAATVLAFAGLLGRSRWQADEYITLTWMIRIGRPFLIHWYLTWSPRLVSDALFAAYGDLVHRLHRPLAGSCMAVLWAGLALACLLPAWSGQNPERLRRLFAGLSLLALCLVGHGVTEVFFWPAGGLSYLPTLAGMVWLFWLAADGMAGAGHLGAAAALTIIAGSSEVGIFFTLTFGALAVAWGRHRLATLWWLLPGLILALADLALVMHGRVGTIESTAGAGNPYLHHIGASFLGALPRFWSQLVSAGPANDTVLPDPARLVARLLVLLGARWCLSPGTLRATGYPAGLLVPFAGAALLTSFLSIATALYQFGGLCCERHDTMRECLLMLACIGLGTWSAKTWPPNPLRIGVLPTLTAICLLGVRQATQLPHEYALYPAATRARASTWQSGLRDGSSMTLVEMPAGRVIGSDGFTPGVFQQGPAANWGVAGVMLFFGKTQLTVE